MLDFDRGWQSTAYPSQLNYNSRNVVTPVEAATAIAVIEKLDILPVEIFRSNSWVKYSR